jgi:hypothetical protein
MIGGGRPKTLTLDIAIFDPGPTVCCADTTPANDLFAQGQVGLDKRCNVW